jgi:hypothetical protein
LLHRPAQLDTIGFEGQRSRCKADIVRRPRVGDPLSASVENGEMECIKSMKRM